MSLAATLLIVRFLLVFSMVSSARLCQSYRHSPSDIFCASEILVIVLTNCVIVKMHSEDTLVAYIPLRMHPPARTARKPYPAFRQDDCGQRRARTRPTFRNRRLVIQLITRHPTSHKREKPQARERFKQRCGLQQRVLSSSVSTGVSIGIVAKKEKLEYTYEIVLLHESDNVQCLEVRQVCGELWEELVWRRRVND